MPPASEVIDVAEVIARHPQVCLVDGLAYDNPSGSRHARRGSSAIFLPATDAAGSSSSDRRSSTAYAACRIASSRSATSVDSLKKFSSACGARSGG